MKVLNGYIAITTIVLGGIIYVEMTIYIDVLWLRTFFVELHVCVFLNLWMKQMCPTLRIVWQCAVAVSLETLLFAVVGYGPVFAVTSPLLRALLLKFLFRVESGGVFLRLFLWSIVATIAAGGMLGLCREHLPESCWFAAGSVICALSVIVSLILEERRTKHDGNLYRITLRFGERAVEVVGLYDTGNRLCDPYVHAPVHILARTQAQVLLLDPAGRRLVPFSAVGVQEGLLEVWTIDAMEWQEGRREHAVIGVAEDLLFEGKDYRLILNAGWKE